MYKEDRYGHDYAREYYEEAVYDNAKEELEKKNFDELLEYLPIERFTTLKRELIEEIANNNWYEPEG